MTTEELQNLGTLLTGGEDSAMLAREAMIGQGIWNAQGVCDCLNAVAPVRLPRNYSKEWQYYYETREMAFFADDAGHGMHKNFTPAYHKPTDPTTPIQ